MRVGGGRSPRVFKRRHPYHTLIARMHTQTHTHTHTHTRTHTHMHTHTKRFEIARSRIRAEYMAEVEGIHARHRESASGSSSGGGHSSSGSVSDVSSAAAFDTSDRRLSQTMPDVGSFATPLGRRSRANSRKKKAKAKKKAKKKKEEAAPVGEAGGDAVAPSGHQVAEELQRFAASNKWKSDFELSNVSDSVFVTTLQTLHGPSSATAGGSSGGGGGGGDGTVGDGTSAGHISVAEVCWVY